MGGDFRHQSTARSPRLRAKQPLDYELLAGGGPDPDLTDNIKRRIAEIQALRDQDARELAFLEAGHEIIDFDDSYQPSPAKRIATPRTPGRPLKQVEPMSPYPTSLPPPPSPKVHAAVPVATPMEVEPVPVKEEPLPSTPTIAAPELPPPPSMEELAAKAAK
jgi:hypothetical protein